MCFVYVPHLGVEGERGIGCELNWAVCALPHTPLSPPPPTPPPPPLIAAPQLPPVPGRQQTVSAPETRAVGHLSMTRHVIRRVPCVVPPPPPTPALASWAEQLCVGSIAAGQGGCFGCARVRCCLPLHVPPLVPVAQCVVRFAATASVLLLAAPHQAQNGLITASTKAKVFDRAYSGGARFEYVVGRPSV